jgi:hypothetical protein
MLTLPSAAFVARPSGLRFSVVLLFLHRRRLTKQIIRHHVRLNAKQIYSPSAAVHRNVLCLLLLKPILGVCCQVSFHDTTYDVTPLHASLKAICGFTPSNLARVCA